MLRSGQVLQLVVMALLGLAVVMVQSAAMTVGQGTLTLEAMLLNRTTLYAVAAILAMGVASQVDVRKLLGFHGWHNPLFWLLAVAMVLVILAMIPGIGVTINGAWRWLRLGPPGWGLTFQPSEMVKWTLILAVALWCHHRSDRMKSFKDGLLPPMIGLGISCLLIVKEDLGTAALVGLVSVILLLAGGVRWWHLLTIIPPAVLGLFLAIIQSPYRKARLISFLDPFSDAQGAGYQAIQSMLAIAQGGLLGRGLGNGVQKFGYLPADTTDFIYATICEELGLVGAAAVPIMYLLLLWFGLGIVQNCRDLFGKLVVLGVILTIGFQALINMAVVTVVVPTKGIALPFLSSGGTGWIMTAMMIGLVAGIDKADSRAADLAGDDSPPRFQDQVKLET